MKKMTLKDKIKLFEKFASHHEVNFFETYEGDVLYCNTIKCDECCIRNECAAFTRDEMTIIREKYPEYFI